MAISPPRWCSDAIPTPRGWTDPKTGELLKSARISQADIDEFNGVEEEELIQCTIEEIFEEEEPSMLTEAPVGNKAIEEMTKIELEALGRTQGIELDRRQKKETLVGIVKNLFE